MNIKFEVKRRRFSATQGEAEVLVNGQSIVVYGDTIAMGGEHGENIDGWGSTLSDCQLITAATKQYPDKIIETAFTRRVVKVGEISDYFREYYQDQYSKRYYARTVFRGEERWDTTDYNGGEPDCPVDKNILFEIV